MSKAEEKKQKREGCFLLHWILFYYYKPQGQEHNIVEVWFGLVWFRERKLRGRSCVAVMRERERERERWLRKKKRGWAWMGIQLDMEYCEVDYEKKKTSNDT